MRRLALLIAVGATWLFLAAIPALADGGPHVAANNNGTSTLTADSCAGCHRAHTAQGPMIIAVASEEDLCLSCHGSTGVGATTNVEDGVQYALGATGLRGTGEAGALRAGGFVNARIAATGITRVPYPRDGDSGTAGVQVTASFSEYIPVAATGSAVTSAHMHVGTGPDVTGPGIAWGNGAESATADAGPTVSLECTSCHNVHGNNQYRILNPVPDPEATVGTFVPITSLTNPTSGNPMPPATVADVRTNPTGADDAGVRNYTVKWGATLADVVDGTYPNTASPNGDYWRLYQPYNVTPTWDGVVTDPITNPAGLYSGDIPEFIPAGNTGASGSSSTWRSSISSWCATCHTRYHTASTAVMPATGLAQTDDSGDAIFTYRHGTVNRQCTICHVSHGSNAAMTGAYSSQFPYPDSTTATPDLSASSRLLKVANRGTCQACHDPTGTIAWNSAPITH